LPDAPPAAAFAHPLKLVDAFQAYDASFHLSRRRHVPPTFAELRHVFNIASVKAAVEGGLQLATFDADGTLYADGHRIERDSDAMVMLLVSLMRLGVHVSIVTAAGYPGEAAKFEGRIAGLLAAFRRLKLPADVVARFHLMGGECNYLCEVDPATYRLRFVPDEAWQTPEMRAWREPDVAALLDDAQRLLLEGAARLALPVTLIRKPRAVGVVPTGPTIYEVLEDLALSVQRGLMGRGAGAGSGDNGAAAAPARLPFCAFNGGNDVFVDVGNKAVGLRALVSYLGVGGQGRALHVGDRFTASGNDAATRGLSSTCWVANPEETVFFTRLLLRELRARRAARYIE
jgi:IMP and pyridine-specific 5'-nucleotidase